mgnify:CR=1 FL=1
MPPEDDRRHKPRAPRTGGVLLNPVLLLNGGRAIQGDVRPAAIVPDKWVSFPGGGDTPAKLAY